MIWVPISFAIVLTLGRFWIRIMHRTRPRADDYLNLLALAFHLVDCGVFQADDGFTGENVNIVAGVIIFSFSWWASQYLVKAAFLALYWSIFNVSQSFRRAWWAVTAITIVCLLVTCFAPVFSCAAAYSWAGIGDCYEIFDGPLYYSNAYWCAMNTLSDILLMILPMGMLWNIHMSLPQKLSLAAIFALTGIDILMDIVRVVVWYTNTGDQLYDVFSVLEPTLSVIICTLPAYRVWLSSRRKLSQRQDEYRTEFRREAAGMVPEKDQWTSIESRSNVHFIYPLTSYQC